jgi:hypothetical protein
MADAGLRWIVAQADAAVAARSAGYSPSFEALFLELVTKGLLVAGMLACGLGIRPPILVQLANGWQNRLQTAIASGLAWNGRGARTFVRSSTVCTGGRHGSFVEHCHHRRPGHPRCPPGLWRVAEPKEEGPGRSREARCRAVRQTRSGSEPLTRVGPPGPRFFHARCECGRCEGHRTVLMLLLGHAGPSCAR